MEQAKKLFLMSLTIVSLGTMGLQTSARRFLPALDEDVIQSVNGLLDAYSYNPYILLSSGELLTERVAPIAGIFPHLEEAIKAKLASLFLLTSSSDFTIIDDE